MYTDPHREEERKIIQERRQRQQGQLALATVTRAIEHLGLSMAEVEKLKDLADEVPEIAGDGELLDDMTIRMRHVLHALCDMQGYLQGAPRS